MFTSVSSLFKDNFNLSISIFDSSRGKSEGDEYEKVLCFYPPNVSENVQCSIVGLAQAVITFSNTFDKKEQEYGFMEAENNRWIAFNCEASIWVLMVVRKAWVGSTCTNVALYKFLTRAYGTFVLLNGSISNLLQQDTTGDTVHMLLQAHIQGVAEHLQRSDSPVFAEMTNPLSIYQACPMLPVSRKAFLGVQSLVNNLLILNVYGARVLHGCMLMYGHTMLWSTLSEQDTQHVYSYTHTSILPNVKAQSASSAVAKAAGSFFSSTSAARYQESHDYSQGIGPSTKWSHLHGGFMAPDTALSRMASGRRNAFSESLSPLFEAPQIWLQGGQEPCRLLPYQSNQLTVLLLLHDTTSISQDVLSALQEEVVPRCSSLSDILSRQVPANNLWHVPGYRYLYLDHLTASSRGTPANKVGTLGQASRAALTQLRNTLDPVPNTAAGESESDMEVICRAHHECWLVARRSGPRELYIAMEQEREGNLVGVAEHVQCLCDEEFPGVFEI